MSHSTHQGSPRPRGRDVRAGFTLLELMIVIILIGVVMAITVPQLIPVIAFSELEGSARRLSGFGRAAVAQAAFLGEEVTVYVDLESEPQEFYAVQLVYPDTEGENEGEIDEDQFELFDKIRRENDDLDADALSDMLASGELDSFSDSFDSERLDKQMSDRFAKFHRERQMVRVKNVKHEESLVDEIGSIFDDKEFSLEPEDEPEEVELTFPTLERTRLPGKVKITSVEIDGAPNTGVVEIAITPLGLEQEVRFYLQNEDRDEFTVIWDAVHGTTNIQRGRVSS